MSFSSKWGFGGNKGVLGVLGRNEKGPDCLKEFA